MPEGSDNKSHAGSAAPVAGTFQGRSDAAQAFISYASADRAIANAVCAALESDGVRCWIAPRDVTPGELYAANIVHALDTTAVLVLVLSQHAAASAHVLREVERATSKRHPILSFRIDQAPLPESLEYFLNTSQWLDASATGADRALPRLVEAVKSVSAKSTAAALVNRAPLVAVKAEKRSSRMLLTLAAVIAAALAFVVVDRFWLSKPAGGQKALVEATAKSQHAPVARPHLRVFFQMSKSLEYEKVIRDGFRKGLEARVGSQYDIAFEEGTGTRQSYWSSRDTWRDIADEIVVRHPDTNYIVTVGSDATSAMVDNAISERLAAAKDSGYKGMLILGVTDPMRAGFANMDSATGISGRAVVRYGSGANDWAGTILHALDESRLAHKPEFIYTTDQLQDSWVAAELAGSRLNGGRIHMTGPIKGKLTLARLDPKKIYFAWYALDELVDSYSSKMLDYRIVPSTYTEANVQNFGLVVSPLDAEVGERGAEYLAKAILEGTPLETLPTQGPRFHTWINCSAVEKKGIPLSPWLKPAEVHFVADAGQATARTDCLKNPSG
jgi:TIR domain